MKRTWQVWLLYAVCLAVALPALAWLSVTTLRLEQAELTMRGHSRARGKDSPGVVAHRHDADADHRPRGGPHLRRLPAVRAEPVATGGAGAAEQAAAAALCRNVLRNLVRRRGVFAPDESAPFATSSWPSGCRGRCCGDEGPPTAPRQRVGGGPGDKIPAKPGGGSAAGGRGRRRLSPPATVERQDSRPASWCRTGQPRRRRCRRPRGCRKGVSRPIWIGDRLVVARRVGSSTASRWCKAAGSTGTSCTPPCGPKWPTSCRTFSFCRSAIAAT